MLLFDATTDTYYLDMDAATHVSGIWVGIYMYSDQSPFLSSILASEEGNQNVETGFSCQSPNNYRKEGDTRVM